MDCPVCENSNTNERFEINSYKILDCTLCGHRFTGVKLNYESIRKIYSDSYFFEGKDGYPDYTLEKDMLIARGERYAELLSGYMREGTLLDVGAAAGFIMKGFENKGWKVTGLEPNSSMAAYGKDTLGLDIRVGAIEEQGLDLKTDLVILIQVIAHLFDLNRTMNSINRIIRRGGYLLIETWDKDSYMARMLGRGWHEYSPPSTLNFFSRKSLDVLMNKHGFRKISAGRPGKKIHARHAKSLIRHKLQSNMSLKWLTGIEKILPDNLCLPYPSEDLFWALYRKTGAD
jgi:SAM-dependent methyltransferase